MRFLVTSPPPLCKPLNHIISIVCQNPPNPQLYIVCKCIRLSRSPSPSPAPDSVVIIFLYYKDENALNYMPNFINYIHTYYIY